MAEPHALLWEHLKDAPRGLTFVRDYDGDGFILPFYCEDAHLAVEIPELPGGGQEQGQCMVSDLVGEGVGQIVDDDPPAGGFGNVDRQENPVDGLDRAVGGLDVGQASDEGFHPLEEIDQAIAQANAGNGGLQGGVGRLERADLEVSQFEIGEERSTDATQIKVQVQFRLKNVNKRRFQIGIEKDAA